MTREQTDHDNMCRAMVWQMAVTRGEAAAQAKPGADKLARDETAAQANPPEESEHVPARLDKLVLRKKKRETDFTAIDSVATTPRGGGSDATGASVPVPCVGGVTTYVDIYIYIYGPGQ